MKYKTAFRLAIRAVGVIVFMYNLPWFLQSAVAILVDVAMNASGGYGGNISWPYALGSLFGQGIGLLTGLYLFFGGKWIINRVIPSNRPYCAECGYELSHLPADYRCPECGTPYGHPVDSPLVEPPPPTA